MKTRYIAFGAFLCLIGCKQNQNPSVVAEENTAPNILIIVADDVGYSDISHHGSEIPTPNIDQLFTEGTSLSQFYVAPSCSPTRAMLLSGTDNHKVGYGSMAESILPWQKGHAGYEGFLNKDITALAEAFQNGGYHTYMTGKWHQGVEPSQFPSQHGFEKSYAMLNGAAFHDGRLLPMPAVFEQNLVTTICHIEDDREVHFPEGGYSTNLYTDKLITYIDANLKDEKPFLGYLALTAPHWPLQAPKEYLEKFKGAYDAGFQEIAQQRIANIKERGIIPAEAEVPLDGVANWDELSDEEKAVEAKRMEIYAAMINNMDDNIGKVISYLKEQGVYDNTVILFFADNGADGSYTERMPLPFEFDNSMENLGNANSFIGLGSNWGHVAALPYRGKKLTGYEGGIKAFATIKTPFSGEIKTSGDLMHITDVYPTLVDLAGLDSIPEQVTGQSFANSLKGEESQARAGFGVEMTNMIDVVKAYRYENYKLVWIPNKPLGMFRPNMEGTWQLFDLANDPTETTNIAEEQPEVFKGMIARYEQYAKENGVLQAPDDWAEIPTMPKAVE